MGSLTGFQNGVLIQSNTTITAFNSPYTLSNTASIFADATGGNITVNVPLAANNGGAVYYIKKTNSSNSVSILPSGGDTIEGEVSKILYAIGETISIISDGISNWSIMSSGKVLLRITEQTDDYTLDLPDFGTQVNMNKGINVDVTVPPYSSKPFPVGTQIWICKTGDGNVNIVEGSGVTVNSAFANKVLRLKYSVGLLQNTAQDVWRWR